ncbi:MAG TPA: hypothetical protein VGB55_06045 [Tepidisphaeraceae bacterium]
MKIIHGDNSTYTEVLEAIAEDTQQIASDTAIIRVQNDLERVDREWEAEMQSYMVTSKHGRHLPSNGDMIAGGIVILFGIMWTLMVAAVAKFMMVFGLLFVAAGIYAVIATSSKKQRYEDGHARYRTRRAALKARLRESNTRR